MYVYRFLDAEPKVWGLNMVGGVVVLCALLMGLWIAGLMGMLIVTAITWVFVVYIGSKRRLTYISYLCWPFMKRRFGPPIDNDGVLRHGNEEIFMERKDIKMKTMVAFLFMFILSGCVTTQNGRPPVKEDEPPASKAEQRLYHEGRQQALRDIEKALKGQEVPAVELPGISPQDIQFHFHPDFKSEYFTVDKAGNVKTPTGENVQFDVGR